MEWYEVLIAAFVTAIVGLNSIVRIPPKHFGVSVRFGRLSNRVLREGIQFKAPLIDSVPAEMIYSLHFRQVSAEAETNAKGGAQVVLSFSIIWRPDPRIRNAEGAIRFVEYDEQIIHDGLLNKAASSVLRCSGDYTFHDLLNNPGGFEDCVKDRLQSAQLERLFGIELVDAAIRQLAFASQKWIEGPIIGDFVAAFVRRQLDLGSPFDSALEMAQLIWNLSHKDIMELKGVRELATFANIRGSL